MQCIAKGKAGKKYALGNKVSLVVTIKSNLVVSALSFTGNPPHDGHALNKKLTQTRSMTEEQTRIKHVCFDTGYRGYKNQCPELLSVDQLRCEAIQK